MPKAKVYIKDIAEEKRSKIVMTQCERDCLDEFRELIADYSKQAHALNERRRQIMSELETEDDIEKRKSLELRKSVLEQERYEILDDMRSMILYVKERSDKKCREG